jgi:hypothetical protein
MLTNREVEQMFKTLVEEFGIVLHHHHHHRSINLSGRVVKI